MEGNGLVLNEKEFMCLKSKDQMCVLYQNQVTTLKLITGYKFHQKVQYVIMSLIFGGLGILSRLQLGA